MIKTNTNQTNKSVNKQIKRCDRSTRYGFTLIELLAVIAILAIVMIIAVPTVLNTIATAKKGAFKDNALSVIKAAEQKMSTNMVEENLSLPLNGSFSTIDINELDIDNRNNLTGAVYILNDNGEYKYFITLNNGEYNICHTLKDKVATNLITDSKTLNCPYLLDGKIKISNNQLVVAADTDASSFSFYSSITGYVSNGLVLHFDGINNTGIGHSNSSNIWKDLTSSNNDMNGITTTKWLENGLSIDKKYTTINNLQTIGNDFTVEVVLLHKDRTYAEIGTIDILLKLRVPGENPWWLGKRINPLPGSIYNKKEYNNLEPLNKITYFSLTNESTSIKALQYMDSSVVAGIYEPSPNTPSKFGFSPVITSEILNGNVYAIRVYNRALSDSEIKQNYDLDKIRFGFTD